MCHAVAGITCDNVNISLIRRISTDVAKAVDWLHHLARPAEHDLPGFGPTDTSPLFQSIETSFEIVSLSALVIFAPDDENLVSTGIAVSEPHIMVWHRP